MGIKNTIRLKIVFNVQRYLYEVII